MVAIVAIGPYSQRRPCWEAERAQWMPVKEAAATAVCECGPDKHSCITRRAKALVAFFYRGFAVATRALYCGRRLWNKDVSPKLSPTRLVTPRTTSLRFNQEGMDGASGRGLRGRVGQKQCIRRLSSGACLKWDCSMWRFKSEQSCTSAPTSPLMGP